MSEANAEATSTAPEAAPAAAALAATSNLIGDAKAEPQGETKPIDGETKQAEGEKKPEDGEKKTEADKPIEYTDFTIPDGLIVDEKLMGDFKALATEAKMTQEQAQKVLDLHTSTLKEAAEAPYRAWTETQQQWQKDVMADKEIGGKNFETAKATIAKALDQVGGNEAAKIREAFNFTGAGNNPEIFRIMYRMANAITEGSIVQGNPAGGGKSLGEKMYPSMGEKS